MTEDEQNEITLLKKEMDELGDINMDKEKRIRYIELRHKQKSERRNEQSEIILTNKKNIFSFNSPMDYVIGFLPFIIIALILWLIMSSNFSDNSGGCVIGRDSQDCRDGNGSYHPLWAD